MVDTTFSHHNDIFVYIYIIKVLSFKTNVDFLRAHVTFHKVYDILSWNLKEKLLFILQSLQRRPSLPAYLGLNYKILKYEREYWENMSCALVSGYWFAKNDVTCFYTRLIHFQY